MKSANPIKPLSRKHAWKMTGAPTVKAASVCATAAATDAPSRLSNGSDTATKLLPIPLKHPTLMLDTEPGCSAAERIIVLDDCLDSPKLCVKSTEERKLAR